MMLVSYGLTQCRTLLSAIYVSKRCTSCVKEFDPHLINRFFLFWNETFPKYIFYSPHKYTLDIIIQFYMNCNIYICEQWTKYRQMQNEKQNVCTGDPTSKPSPFRTVRVFWNGMKGQNQICLTERCSVPG